MRKETKAMQNIRLMCDGLRLNQAEVFHKAKLILSVYRDVVWSTTREADELRISMPELCGHSLDTALTYLSDFAPADRRQDFEARVSCLFETKWMIGLIDTALMKVRDYHNCGKLYFEILSKCYLSAYPYSEDELLEAVNMDRSTYYDRKKEAVMLLGVALWGYAIPQLQGMFQEELAENADTPTFFMKSPT